MNTWIALLRGINVSGQKKIQMSDLKAVFDSCDFSGVQTYIQSGNVVFVTKESSRKKLIDKIEKSLQASFSYSIPVVLREADTFTKAVEAHPWLKKKGIDPKAIYFSFARDVEGGKLKKVEETSAVGDSYLTQGEQIYLYCPGGFGKTKFNNNYFEKKLGIVATTRNLNTCNKLINLAGV
ncbi:MAG: DUF1697 domain-containing protein [Gammaproteobacteria bacterium]|nr:DUF1697 domain-containing protein [Gammaproteobacteria bacterium]MDH5692255.1 DUF1697 domain-containing protein [Gammaproteobacteria bacterium]